MFHAVLNSARLSLAFGAFAALLSTSITFAQATEYARNPASKFPIVVNGMIERVGGNWESGVFRGRWICTQGIVENFSAIALAPVSPEPVGPNDPPGSTMFTKYFQAHPDADGVMLVGGTCAPWNCGDPLYGFGFTPTVDGDVYSFPGCETDFVEFNATIRNPGAQLYGFKFRGDPTKYALRIYSADMLVTYVSGHAFVEFLADGQATRMGKNTYSWGPVNIPITRGRILDEVDTLWTERIEWPLTRARYNAAIAKARRLKWLSDMGDDVYWVFRQNCVDFAAQIAEAAGVDMPRYRMLSPPYAPAPYELSVSIRDAARQNGGCHGDERPRGRCMTLQGNFGGGQPRYHADPGFLVDRCMHNPEQAAASFLSKPTYHTGPTVTVGRNQEVSLSIGEAYPQATLLVTDFDDGTDPVPVLVSPAVHRYPGVGVYNARVMAIDPAGLHVISVTIEVTKKAGPAAAVVTVPLLPPLEQPLNPGDDAVMPAFARTYPADVTCDWATNGEDLAMILANWGSQVPTIADIDGDGVVSGNDLAVVLAGWGAPTP